MDYLILILFVVEILILGRLDRALFGTYITPMVVLTVPYLLIVLLSIFIGPSMGFVTFYYPSLWIWIVGVLIFWFPGYILATLILHKTNLYHYPYTINLDFKMDRVVLTLSYLIICILAFELIITLRQAKIGTEAFSSAFGGGISGHSLLISRFLLVYLIVRFKKKYIIPILLILIFAFSYGVKGWILIPVLSGFFIRILLRLTRLNVVIIVSILIIGLVGFYLVYRIRLGTGLQLSFIFSNIMKYIFSGPLGLSEYIKKNHEVGFDPLVVINPIINIYNKFFGNGKLFHYKNIMTYIGANGDTNTKTFFGTVYIYSGALWGILFSFIVGLITYFYLIIFIKTKNLIFMVIYGTYLTIFFFGWFDSYTGNLFFYEFPVFGILFFLAFYFFELPKKNIIRHISN